MKIIYLALLIVLIGCFGSDSGGGSSPAPSCGNVSDQIFTSAGSSAGLANYSLSLTNGTVGFNNLNLTFYGGTNGGVSAIIVDTGAYCLDQVNLWPGATSSGTISVIMGHTYVVQFKRVINFVESFTYSKFTPTSYSGGVVNVTYVPHL